MPIFAAFIPAAATCSAAAQLMRTCPAQVQLYFPQIGHPAYGIVRGIVKDSTDFYQGLSSVTFLDSDGKVGCCRTVLTPSSCDRQCSAARIPCQQLDGMPASD